VIGHQWWWEFRYTQYQIVTANELYLPVGRTVNFTLHSADVIHSFWVPALNGKRDVVTNRTNYLWYTPDSSTLGAGAFNGACAEYCGDSHANMRFKAFTVSQADFESWAKHQQESAVGTAVTVTPATGGAPPQPPPATAQNPASAPQTASVQLAGFIAFPPEKMPAYAVPQTPLPSGLRFDDSLLGKGDVANGKQLMQSSGGCLACHSIKGNPMMVGVIGPNLTHIATRTTIAAGLFPNDAQHLARWVKNAREMKPGVTMFTIGQGEYDPILKTTQKAGLTDQQIADVVAYLQTLK